MSAADLHIHSNFSIDSRMSVAEICTIAIEKGLSIICITDHLDLDPSDEGFGFYKFEEISVEIRKARERFGDRLTILKGVEFGEPHRHMAELDQVLSRDYDMIMGSVHIVGGLFVGDPRFMEGRSLGQAFDLYYAEVLRLVEAGGFDVLAHLDFPKRYIGSLEEDPPIVAEIVGAMAASGIALEVNTSPLRKGLSECSPDADIVSLFMAAGGKRVTVGSDAHRPAEIASGLEIAGEMLQGKGAVHGFFKGRHFTPLA